MPSTAGPPDRQVIPNKNVFVNQAGQSNRNVLSTAYFQQYDLGPGNALTNALHRFYRL